MRFLADESCDFGVVLALRTAGHDVAAIAEVSPREEDDSSKARTSIAKTVVDIVRRRGERLKGKFTVIQPGRVRFGRLP